MRYFERVCYQIVPNIFNQVSSVEPQIDILQMAVWIDYTIFDLSLLG